MMKRIVLAVALFCIGLIGLMPPANAQVIGCGGGGATVIGGRTLFLGVSGNCGSPSYTGPGDCSGCLTSSVKLWGGLRAYSAAKRGTKAVNACNSTGGVDVGCADLLTDAVTGKLVAATVSGITCPGANCTVKTIYDQSGGTNCGGSACDMTQAVVLNRPTLDASCISTLPCMNFNVTNPSMSNSTGFGAVAEPFTISLAFNRPTNPSQYRNIVSDSGGNGILEDNVANGVLIYNGNLTTGEATASDGSIHAGQFVSDQSGAGSYIMIDGSTTAVNIGGTQGWASGGIFLSTNVRAGSLGKLAEVGFWSAAFTAGQALALNANQQAYGF
jgi:hypothetical protein